MENIITPRSEIKVASQYEINKRKIKARTEYETRKLAGALEDIDFQIKCNAKEGRKWLLYNPWRYSFGDEYLPYKDIYEDIINELTYKGYIAKRHKVFLSNKDLISVIIEENEDIHKEITKNIKSRGRTNFIIYGLVTISYLLLISLFTLPLIARIK